MRRGWALAGAAVMLAAGGAAWAAFGVTTQNGGNVFTAAADFCSNPGAVTVVATADSWIDENRPDRNHGTDTSLEVQSKNGQDTRTVVGFSLPAEPAGCDLAGAELRMYATDGASGTRTLQAIRLAAPWTEGAVTWANQPGTTGVAAEIQSPSSAGWREWSVTAQVQAMYDAGQANGFLVRDKNEDNSSGENHHFRSREQGSERPELVVTFS